MPKPSNPEALRQLTGRQIKYLDRDSLRVLLAVVCQILGLANEDGIILTPEGELKQQEIPAWQVNLQPKK